MASNTPNYVVKETVDNTFDTEYVSNNDQKNSIMEDGENLPLEQLIQKNISKNIRNLNAFFRTNNFITEKGDQRTNIINVSEKKTYNVPDTHIEELFIALDECRKEKRMLHYSERQETEHSIKSGIMIDFDRYQKSKDAQVTQRHFDALTRQIGKLLSEFIDFKQYAETDKFIFRIFYIRKPGVVLVPPKTPGETPVYKDGWHILIPEIQTTKGLKRHLMQELINRDIIKKVFKDIDHINDAADMLDKMSASAPVYFLGNSKIGKPAYPLTNAYELTVYTDDDDIDRRALDIDMINSGFVQTDGKTDPLQINLTYELSLNFYTESFQGRNTWLRKIKVDYRASLETKIQLIVEKSSKNLMSDDDLLESENSVDILTIGNAEASYIKKLLEIIDIKYATEYELWFKVICAIAHTNSNYKPLAVWFSHRKPESWSQDEVDRVWSEALHNKYTRCPVTKRSIIYWAKESSPQRFREIEKENYFQVLSRSAYEHQGRVEHAQAAKVCHSMIGDKFVVDVGVNDKTGKMGYCWLEFVLPGQAMKKGEVYKWRKELEPDNIHLFIAEHMPKVYSQLSANIKDRKERAENEAETKYWANVENNFRLYTAKLGNDTFQNGIIKQAQYKFRQRGFMEEMDSYEDIIGVGNGVLKLGSKPKLIKGFHEYKISKFTDTDYIPYNPESPYVKTLMDAIRDIFPEPDVCDFMLYHASTGLDFYESACILLLLVGGGQNGKSFFAKMIHNTLGNMYCASGKSGLLTSNIEKADSANSAQMQMKDKRYFYFDEFNKCELLNTARVKAMVSPQWQSGRDLHTRQCNFKNTCNPIALSNFDFIIDTTDHGTWRRIYYYRNKVKFCRNPAPGNIYEKRVNPKFIDEYTNSPDYKQAMLSILVHYNAKLHSFYGGDIKNVPSETIARETEDFRNRQDALNKFITQMIFVSPGAEPIGMTVLAGKYSEWYVRNIKDGKQTIVDIQSQFDNSRIAAHLVYHSSGVKMLKGHRIKDNPEDPLEEGETNILPSAKPIHAVIIPTTSVLSVPKKENYDDNFISNLVNNAPTHIQQTIDNTIDNIADIDIEDLLDDI